MTCAVEECASPVRSKGLCNRHYLRLRRNGDPEVVKSQRYGDTSLCEADGCTARPLAKGLCRPHYERKSRSGTTDGLHEQPLGRPLAERFWEKVDRSGDGCWIWLGSKTRREDGYGQIRVDGRMQVAHRIAYELVVGPIPDGLDLDHRCRVRACVNPEHLQPVTPFVNFSRGQSPMASFARQTHCLRGHPLSGSNLAITNGGRSRRCRTCKRDNERARRAHASPDGPTSGPS